MPGLPGRCGRLWPEEQPPALAADDIDEPAALEALPLAGEYVAVDARLEALLDAGEGVEVEGEEPLAVEGAQGLGEEVPQEAQAVTRVRVRGAESPASKGIRRQFACCSLLARRSGCLVVSEKAKAVVPGRRGG